MWKALLIILLFMSNFALANEKLAEDLKKHLEGSFSAGPCSVVVESGEFEKEFSFFKNGKFFGSVIFDLETLASEAREDDLAQTYISIYDSGALSALTTHRTTFKLNLNERFEITKVRYWHKKNGFLSVPLKTTEFECRGMAEY